MNEFVVTARKWRPLFFKDVVGQEHITQTLKNAVLKNRIHHAYLFSGPRGVGKTTTARILSRSINCLNPQDAEPCNDCDNCRAVMEGRSMDVIEIDGASNNSVDDIRKLRENSKYPPSNGRYKMYIIDEVHMLSNAAFNALLKTLEEPPPHLMFVFATTEVHKVLPTITSRCQRFDFRRMEIEDITGQLAYIAEKEGITIDEESLVTIAKKGDGSMRDSQSIFDQVISFCGKNIIYSELADALHLIDEEFFFSITNAVKTKDTAAIFELVGQVVRKGYDFQETLQGLLEHLRNLTAVKVTGDSSILETSSQMRAKYLTNSADFAKLDLIRMMNHIAQAEQSLKFTPQPRIRFELALLQLAHIDSTVDIAELISELKVVKKTGLKNTGTLNANVPTLSAGIIAAPKSTSKTTSVNEPNSVYKKIQKKLTPDQFFKVWDEFIASEEVTKSGFRLENCFVELDGRTIILTCNTDFEKSYLDSRSSRLQEIVEEMYDLFIKFEIKLKKTAPATNTGTPIINPKNNYVSIESSKEKRKINSLDPNLHPVEKMLIEDFGAELLMDNSSER
ncbi:MAG: DNA polymerase III subunit gamma/tau [Candidatus Kapabacteria bacterium]|nr:DNA polymerase III subunit gamma/tau [Ignavibacteriota bacterium]MCW5884406.1 DNA polymerase III subunit gamma/tau [Candidatus Kapabacteria bacterium]